MKMTKNPNNSGQSATVIGNNINITQQIIKIGEHSPLINTHPTETNSPRTRLGIVTENPFRKDTTKISYLLKTALNWVQQIQNEDRGIPTNGTGTESVVWSTVGLLHSSWVFSSETPQWWKSGLQWALSKSNSFAITDATASTLLCLTAINEESFVASRSKIAKWIINAQRKDGSWPWYLASESSNVVSTGYAILSLWFYLRTLNNSEKNVEITQVVLKGVQSLISARNIDFGWGSDFGDKSRPANTGFITYVLNVVGFQDLCEESKFFLTNTFNSTQNGWADSLDRPAPYSATRLGLPYAILGLSCMQPDRQIESIIDDGVSLLLDNFEKGAYCIPTSNARTWPTRDFMFACSSLIG